MGNIKKITKKRRECALANAPKLLAGLQKKRLLTKSRVKKSRVEQKIQVKNPEKLLTAKLFFERLLDHIQLRETCPHYIVGSASFQPLICGVLTIARLHNPYLASQYRDIGKPSEEFCAQFYERLQRSPCRVSSVLPFVCATPDFIAFENGKPLLVEVKSKKSVTGARKILSKKKFYWQMLVSMEIFNIEQADYLIVVRTTPKPTLLYRIRIHKNVKIFENSTVIRFAINNYVTLIKHYFLFFYGEVDEKELEDAKKNLFSYAESHKNTHSYVARHKLKMIGACNMAVNFHPASEKVFKTQKRSRKSESLLKEFTSSAKYEEELATHSSKFFWGGQKKRSQSLEVGRNMNARFFRSKSEANRLRSKYNDELIINDDPVPKTCESQSITFGHENFDSLLRSYLKFEFDS